MAFQRPIPLGNAAIIAQVRPVADGGIATGTMIGVLTLGFGSPQTPVSGSQLEGKLESLVGDQLPVSQSEQLVNQSWVLDSVENIRDVLCRTGNKLT